ncbi:hypothetical protein E2C01_089742 [Portunus trituberculatus]|uniref:Uncharacterized protein n=1 Tax=Portunus trituberculatus TaxID=210409 RepID=A0A5B7JN92_PORTR|nr:hypothetical protein [Portunus trituberculatus]
MVGWRCMVVDLLYGPGSLNECHMDPLEATEQNWENGDHRWPEGVTDLSKCSKLRGHENYNFLGGGHSREKTEKLWSRLIGF